MVLGFFLKEKEPVVRSDAPLIGEEPRAGRGPDYTSPRLAGEEGFEPSQ